MKAHRILSGGLTLIVLTISLGLLAGCGGGGSSTVGDGGGGGTPTLNGAISGTAIKGPVANATVTAFSINANGAAGGVIGTGKTDAHGNFSISVGDYLGPMMLRMTGGTYMDEATGMNMNMGQNDALTCVIPSMTAGSMMSGIQMTPLTSMAQGMAQNMPGGMTQSNISQANNSMGNYFSVNDILHTVPMNPNVDGSGATADQNMKNYGMTIAAMSQYANMIGMPNSSGMVAAMMNDASDGHMNGMMGNSGVMMGGGMMGGTRMSPNAGITGLANAMMQFTQAPMNKSGVTVQDMANLINRLNTSNGAIQ